MTLMSAPDSGIGLPELLSALPQTPLFSGTDADPAPNGSTAAAVGWTVSPEPYALTQQQWDTLQTLGPDLWSFNTAIAQLFRQSHKEPQWAWVKDLFYQGKPDSLMTFSQMNRVKSHVPMVIRPDLLVTENGFALCEVDAVPGGLGFTSALNQAYSDVGASVIGDRQGLPEAFLAMLRSFYKQHTQRDTDPSIALIVSDEAKDYRAELEWLVNALQPSHPNIALVHPKQLSLVHKQLGYLDADDAFHPIDLIYRFFELFDLPNIPNIELIQYAVKKGLVLCTPPFKPFLEEKLTLALIHHPQLTAFWTAQMGQETFDRLSKLIPDTWILDPTPIPPHAGIVPKLTVEGHWVQRYDDLNTLTQTQRRLVVKPSGFSPLAWGSRGVTVGHDVPQTQWQETLSDAFRAFGTTPYLLQRYDNPKIEPYRYFDPVTQQPVAAEGRTRLCPYYVVVDNVPQLSGILATTCPKNKKVIHGMRDGVMRPASRPN